MMFEEMFGCVWFFEAPSCWVEMDTPLHGLAVSNHKKVRRVSHILGVVSPFFLQPSFFSKTSRLALSGGFLERIPWT